ncbi:SsgA family sporulation/cell division regulator [Kibdelosporangium philippinense]|uniref:SsgA family sporulation/cell division regulator n=1 Tax=Kibdelosporangium philippinense TaxID=211113 RepID=A0ABS8ZEP1_9PSEU|nr:SsgA family sporulation/cell division regulator [Kibdelosporangium philippinense]MCE7006278.1 SsgA family sporulation/cell division regulator [Kibdelosporangium philippinense]
MTRNDHTEIISTVTFDLVSAHPVPVDVELRYDTRDPFAVYALFEPEGARAVQWILSRDLLADGLIVRTGDGDVRMWPDPENEEMVSIEFVTPKGQARFEAHAEDLAEFLDMTYEVVVPGAEDQWFDFDAEIERMIAAG